MSLSPISVSPLSLRWLLLLIAAVPLCLPAQERQRPTRPSGPSKNEKHVGRQQAEFAATFHRELAGGGDMKRWRPGKNLVVGSYGVYQALATVHLGARGGTARQLSRAMGIEDMGLAPFHTACQGLTNAHEAEPQTDGFSLILANSLWGHRGRKFQQNFVENVRRLHGDGLQPVDLRRPELAAAAINDWAAERTSELITRVVLPQHLKEEGTRLVLVNATFFKGQWAVGFPAGDSAKRPFRLPNGDVVQVQTMQMLGRHRYARSKSLTILEKPYKGDLSMVFIVPASGAALLALEKALSYDLLSTLVSKAEWQEVIVSLPRFTIASTMSIKQPLIGLGVKSMFEHYYSDLSGMGGKKYDLHVAQALHAAMIEIDEAGAKPGEPADLVRHEGGERVPVFRANRPFLFFVRQRQTGAILYTGRVLDPQNLR
jgi:serpin B